MKVVYNWLKDFVDVAASVEELASRLALSGTNIGGVEKGVQGGVIDAEVTSNRPDCLGLLGIAREIGAIYKTPLKNVSPKPVESAAAKAGAAAGHLHDCGWRRVAAGRCRRNHGWRGDGDFVFDEERADRVRVV